MEKSMVCKKIVELLPRFIENDFTQEEYSEILEHLNSCERCKKEYESMKKLIDRIENIPLLNVPPSFKEAVMKIIKKEKDGTK